MSRLLRMVVTLAAGAALVSPIAVHGEEFAYRLDPEFGVPYEGVTTTEIQTRMQGMDVDVTMTVQMTQDVVFEAGDDDTVIGRYAISSVSAETEGLPGMDHMPFDLNDIYQGVAGSTFAVEMTRTGQVVDFSGLQELLAGMMDRLDVPDELLPTMNQWIETNFGEEQMKQMTGHSGLSMPDRPVAMGESWTDSVAAFGLETETTYTLAERADGRATVQAAGSLSGGDDAAIEFPGLPDIPGLEMRFENVSGSVDGSFELDETTGLTVAYSLDTSMDTDMVMEMPEIEDQSVDATAMSMSLSVQTIVKGELRKAEQALD